MSDVLVIGAGLNGLVAALSHARRKRSVVVVDQRPEPGGAAITVEIAPGYRVPALSHSLGPLSATVVRGLQLDRAGLEFIAPDPALTTFGRDGRTIVFHRDAVLTAASIAAHSSADAGRWIEFTRATQRVAAVLSRLGRHAPPAVDDAGFGDAWRMLGVARQARALGRRDLARLLRWLPMPVGDLVGDWFETDLLKAAIAAHAISGHAAGPRSGGTGGLLLQRIAADAMPIGSGTTVRGGPGALTSTLARLVTDAGGSIRLDARVTRITTVDGRATGVVLANGDVLEARAVVAAIPPKRVLLDLLAPTDLPPSVRERASRIRSRGVTAKVNLALERMPAWPALGGDAVPLGGRLLLAEGLDDLERAFDATKYGAMSDRPWLEIAMPSVADPSLAPPGGHVMSITAHFAPRDLRGTTWATERDTLWRRVQDVLEPHAPDLSRLVVARQIITPQDLEDGWGLPGGHIFHGEMTLDQSWVARPFLGLGRYDTPVKGLYLASAGVHPGGGLTGLPGWMGGRATVCQRTPTGT